MLRPIVFVSLAVSTSVFAYLFNKQWNIICSLVACVGLSYFIILFFDKCQFKDGLLSPAFQRLSIWRRIGKYFDAEKEILSVIPIDPKKQYIFVQFPHGFASVGHLMTMTDMCGFLTDVHSGPRRDLAASILFFLPFMRELVLYSGCVDACLSTAKYNLDQDRSLHIYVGGEVEQLMTEQDKHKIFIKKRKGWAKLAIEYNIPVIPIYCWGENDLYYFSDFMKSVRVWIVNNFRIAIPLCWGPLGFLCPLCPLKKKLKIVVGSPISSDNVDDVHTKVIQEIERIFNASRPSDEVKLHID